MTRVAKPNLDDRIKSAQQERDALDAERSELSMRRDKAFQSVISGTLPTLPQFKVLDENGCSFLTIGRKTPYRWSLPTYQHNTWKPGDWHEPDHPDRALVQCSNALHTTVIPAHLADEHPNTQVWLAELDGEVHHYLYSSGMRQETISRRVRLLRPVYREEWTAASISALARIQEALDALNWSTDRDRVSELDRKIHPLEENLWRLRAAVHRRDDLRARLVAASVMGDASREAKGRAGSPFLVYCKGVAGLLAGISSRRERAAATHAAFEFARRFLHVAKDELGAATTALGRAADEYDYTTEIERNTSFCVAYEFLTKMRPWWITSKAAGRWRKDGRLRVGVMSEFRIDATFPCFDAGARDEDGKLLQSYRVAVTSLTDEILRAKAVPLDIHKNGKLVRSHRPTHRLHTLTREVWDAYWGPQIESTPEP